MQVGIVQNSNYNTSFGEKLKFDTKLITRATREEKSELAKLKRLYKDNGVKGQTVVKNNNKITIAEVIENLRSKFRHAEADTAQV